MKELLELGARTDAQDKVRTSGPLHKYLPMLIVVSEYAHTDAPVLNCSE